MRLFRGHRTLDIEYAPPALAPLAFSLARGAGSPLWPARRRRAGLCSRNEVEALGGCDNPLQALAEKVQALAASPLISASLADGTALSSGGTYDAGSLAYGKSKDITITPYSGTAAGVFTITSRPTAAISPGGSGTLVLSFNGTTPGTNAVSLSIASNDVSTPAWTPRGWPLRSPRLSPPSRASVGSSARIMSTQDSP